MMINNKLIIMIYRSLLLKIITFKINVKENVLNKFENLNCDNIDNYIIYNYRLIFLINF